MDGTFWGNADFSSGDKFDLASEYQYSQGKKPSFTYSVYALDKNDGKIDNISKTFKME